MRRALLILGLLYITISDFKKTTDMITLNIDIDKIDNDKLFKGKKGTYLDAVLIETPKGHNDYMIVQSVSKADRDAGIKGAILGNAKDWNRGKTSRSENASLDPTQHDDLPFPHPEG